MERLKGVRYKINEDLSSADRVQRWLLEGLDSRSRSHGFITAMLAASQCDNYLGNESNFPAENTGFLRLLLLVFKWLIG